MNLTSTLILATAPAPALPTLTTMPAPVVPLVAFALSVAFWGLLLLAGVAWAFAVGAFFGPRWWARWSPARCETPGDSAPLWAGGVALFWAQVVVQFALVALLATRDATGKATLSDAANVALVTAGYAGGLLAVVVLHAKLWPRRAARLLGVAETPFSEPPPRAPMWTRTAIAALIAIALTQVVNTLTALAYQTFRVPHESAHSMLKLMDRAAEMPWVVGGAILNATLLAPIFEELLFRGHLQTALGSLLPRWAAIVVTSMLFAVTHEAWTIPPIFVLSLAIGVAYERTGRLWVAIAIHVAFNAASTAMFFAGRGQ